MKNNVISISELRPVLVFTTWVALKIISHANKQRPSLELMASRGRRPLPLQTLTLGLINLPSPPALVVLRAGPAAADAADNADDDALE